MKLIFVALAAKFERMKFEVQYIIYLLREPSVRVAQWST